MLTERTLRKWRADALRLKSMDDPALVKGTLEELCNRILKLTQEYLDWYLVRRGQ